MRYSGGKFRLGSPPTVQRPEVALPLPLAFILVLCAPWLMTALGYFVSIQLDLSSRWLSPWQMAALVGVGGIAPIVIAWALATNQRWSRILIVGTFLAVPWAIELASPGAFWDPEATVYLTFAAGASALVFTAGFKSSRAYYRLLQGAELSEELRRALARATAYVRIIERLEKLGSLLEATVVALVFLILIVAWFGMKL